MKKILGVLVVAIILSVTSIGYCEFDYSGIPACAFGGGAGTDTGTSWFSGGSGGNGGRCVFSSPSGGNGGEVTYGTKNYNSAESTLSAGILSDGGNGRASSGALRTANNGETTLSAGFASNKILGAGSTGFAMNSKPWYETSTDPKVVDLRTKMNEAVTAVENEFKDKIGDVEDILTDTKKAQKELEDAAWKKCVEDIKAAVKESNWAEISKILTEWKTEKAKIVDQFKDGIKALEDQITDLKKDQETAVKTVKDEFIKQMEAFKPTNGLSFAVGHQPNSAGQLGTINDVSKSFSTGALGSNSAESRLKSAY